MALKIKWIFCFTITIVFCIPIFIQAQTFNFSHNELTRQYFYYEPEGLQANAPLVFVLHGYSGNITSIKDYTQMNKVADENKFAVCYPSGTKDEWGNRFWQVGYEFHESEAVDDVSFISELALYLQNEHNLSKQNTFVTGMSNGGDMSFLLSCQANHFFKAFAPVCGTIMNNRFEYCTAPVSIFAINGDNDNTTWYNGDLDNIGEWGAYLGIPEIINRFVEVNECTDNTTEALPNTNTNDGSSVEFHRYYNGINTNEVWLYKVLNGGHDWPGGSGNRDINASEEVWKFFEKYLTKESTSVLNDSFHHELNIYPNPSNGKIINISTQLKTAGDLCIIDATGKVVYSVKNQMFNNSSVLMPNKLTSGVYIISFGNDRLLTSQKLIVY